MFLAGTRVYACCSAVTGKKLGPKRHSLGYISDSFESYHVKYVRNFPIKNQAFMFCLAKIVFTRYGKEEKQRCETRNFLQILPLFDSGKKPDQIPNLVKDIVSAFNSGELSKNPHWHELCLNYITDPAYIGTVIPLRHVAASEMSGKNISAWASAILQSKTFRALISNNKLLPTLMQLSGDRDVFKWVANSARMKSARRDLVKWSEDSTDNMRRLSSVLLRVNTAFNKRLLDSNIKEGKLLLEHAFQANSFLTWLSAGMFESERINTMKGDIVKHAAGTNSEHHALACHLESTRSIYLNLKPKYV